MALMLIVEQIEEENLGPVGTSEGCTSQCRYRSCLQRGCSVFPSSLTWILNLGLLSLQSSRYKPCKVAMLPGHVRLAFH